jgi:hypothetical protein
MHKTLVLILLLTAVAAGQMPVPALPRMYIDTTWNPPSGGAIWHPRGSADLQNALNSAHPGDTIVLDAGSVYTGNFTLPAKANPIGQWIYIQSSALSRLPAPGVRIGPSNTPNMAKIVTPNGSPALNPLPGANHYRLVGLEVTTASNQGCQPHYTPPINCFTYVLFGQPDGGLGHPTQLPDSITFDRVYMHGSNTYDVREGIQGNVTNLAVIDSYISDIHQSTADSQAIIPYFTPGPIKIVNNFLSATTEDVMIGGAGGADNPYIPSDIEIRRNHFFKPLAWDSCGAGGTLGSGGLQPNGVPCPPGLGHQWVEKNNLEFKSGQRVLVKGNVMENTWVSGQVGYSVLLTVRTTGDAARVSVVDDITIESNILMNVYNGFNTLEHNDGCVAPACTTPGETKRIKMDNNLVLLAPANNPHGTGFQVAFDLTDVVFQHNTVLKMDGSKCYFSLQFDGKPGTPWPPPVPWTHNLWVLDNVLCRQPSGDMGGQGTTGLTYYMGDPAPLDKRFLGNVIYVPPGDATHSFPPKNSLQTKIAYADPAAANYQLVSPNWTQTSDKLPAGVDMAALDAATAGAASGTAGQKATAKLRSGGHL